MTKNTLKQLIRECIKKSLNENKMDDLPAHVSREHTRQSRRDQVAISELLTVLTTSKFMENPALFNARDAAARGLPVRDSTITRLEGPPVFAAVPRLRPGDAHDEFEYKHIEIDLGSRTGFLKVYGNPDSTDLPYKPYKISDLARRDRASEDYITEDEVLLLIKNRISNAVDQS